EIFHINLPRCVALLPKGGIDARRQYDHNTTDVALWLSGPMVGGVQYRRAGDCVFPTVYRSPRSTCTRRRLRHGSVAAPLSPRRVGCGWLRYLNRYGRPLPHESRGRRTRAPALCTSDTRTGAASNL